MSLPRFIVLKSNYNGRYLGYVPPKEFKDIDQGVARSRNSFLRFDRDEISTTDTKFEVLQAKIGNNLIHLKSCHNDKYLVRWSTRHWWIVAAADDPEEDRTKWSCTLFELIYVDRNANTVRFVHSQLGHYACLWRIGLPFGGCLFGGSKDPDHDSCDVVTVIDWESLSTSTSRSGGSGAAMVEEDDNSTSTLRSGGSGAAMVEEDDNSTSTLRSGSSGAAMADEDDNSDQVNNIASLPRNSVTAIAVLKGDPFDVKGTITFSQQDPKFVTIIIRIRQIRVDFYALRINTDGDISRGSKSTGSIFYDLDNVEADETGKIQRRITNYEMTLIGEDSIIGRTIAVYSGPNPTPGLPLAWGVIGYAS